MRGHVKHRGRRGWWLVVDDNGGQSKRKRRWINLNPVGQPQKVRTKKEADIEAGRIMQELREGTYCQCSSTVADLLDRWIEDHKWKVHTRSLDRYRTIATKHLKPALGQIMLRDLRSRHVRGFYAQARDAGVSSGVVRYCHITLHAALKYAMQNDMLKHNVADSVEKPKQPKAEIRALTNDELARVLKAAEGSDYRVPIYLAASCGLRRGEALGLKWSNVDFENARLVIRDSLDKTKGQLTFKEPKTNSSRRAVSIPATTMALLKAHRATQAKQRLAKGPAYRDNDLVVAEADGSPMDPDVLTKGFTKLARSLNIAGVHFHCLRHTAATTMLASGVHPKVVQECLGHSSIAITLDIYSHVAPTMQEDAARRMDRVLRAAVEAKSS